MKRSGKYAYVEGIPCTQGWGVNRQSTASRYVASCTPDGSAAVEGNISEMGSVNGLGYLPPMPTEDNFEFIGVVSAKAAEIINWCGDVLIADTTITLPVASGTPISWSSSFGVQGELAENPEYHTGAYLDDSRDPAPSAKWGKIAVETVIDEGDWEDIAIQGATMKFSRGSAQTIEAGLTYHTAGNLEAEISFEIQDDDRGNPLLQVNAIKTVRVYVTETLYYQFDAILFSNQSNFKVDRASNNIIGYTMNGIWTALRDKAGSGPNDLGEIVYPSGDVFYPTGSS